MPLSHPFDQPPAPATLTEVAPGVHWIRMPLPFALDHINLWALEDGDGGWDGTSYEAVMTTGDVTPNQRKAGQIDHSLQLQFDTGRRHFFGAGRFSLYRLGQCRKAPGSSATNGCGYQPCEKRGSR